MAAPTYDDSKWPLFRVLMPRQAQTSAEFAAYLKHIDALFLRGDRFAIVIDAREAPVHTPTERQEIAKHMKASHARFPHRLVGMGIVMSSPLQRGIFTAIMWLAGPTYPIRPFPSPTDAEDWLEEVLRARSSPSEYARRPKNTLS
jgi:hypothetical protein